MVRDAAAEGRPMINSWLVAAFLLGCLLFTYPLLSLFNRDGVVLGVPIFYLYLFVVWAIVIALMAYAAQRRE
jgi:hypothetical protein